MCDISSYLLQCLKMMIRAIVNKIWTKLYYTHKIVFGYGTIYCFIVNVNIC